MWLIWVVFLILLGAGMPIAFVMGIGAMVGLLEQGFSLSLIVNRFAATVTNYSLVSIPLFILAAYMFTEAGATARLVNLCRVTIGSMRGGLSHVNVSANIVMGGISGTAIADLSAIGSVLIPEMKRDGYSAKYAAAVSCAASTVGPIIPPSVPMIVAGVATNQSIGKLFLAGLVPGLLIGLGMLVVSFIIARRRNYPSHERLKGWAIAVTTLKNFPDLMAPVVVIVGLVSGWYTPTEVGAVAVVYGLVLGLIHRELTWAKLNHCALETLYLTGAIFLIIGFAATFTWLIVVNQFDKQMGAALSSLGHPIVILLAINVILVVMGMFMETLSALLMGLPVFIAVGLGIGIDPIQMTVIVVLNLIFGLLTPPVGVSLYIGSILAKEPWEAVFKEMLPFLVPILIVQLLVTFYPPVTLWLPRLLM
jgi:C4-dicarboxylate transporter, DctM subunit